MKTTLAQLRQSTQALAAGKTTLAPGDLTALASINAQREQAVATLANQILNNVRPITATRLRSPGHILEKATAKATGN
jgi:deferrochelatase/peroxidase EfeB